MTVMDTSHESRVTRSRGSRGIISRRAAMFLRKRRAEQGEVLFPAVKEDPARRRGKDTVVLSPSSSCDLHNYPPHAYKRSSMFACPRRQRSALIQSFTAAKHSSRIYRALAPSVSSGKYVERIKFRSERNGRSGIATHHFALKLFVVLRRFVTVMSAFTVIRSHGTWRGRGLPI